MAHHCDVGSTVCSTRMAELLEQLYFRQCLKCIYCRACSDISGDSPLYTRTDHKAYIGDSDTRLSNVRAYDA